MIGLEADRTNHKTYAKLMDIPGMTRRAIRNAFFDLGKDLKAEINRAVLDKSEKTGRVYIVRGPRGGRRRHKSSAAGESHANLGGDLRKSAGWLVHGTDSMDFGYGYAEGRTGLGAAPDYDAAIEEGATFKNRKGKIDPRPSVRNAVEASSRNAERAFDKAMLKEFLK